MSPYHRAAGPRPLARGGDLAYVCIQTVSPPHPSSCRNFLCPSSVNAPSFTPRSYPPGASPPSATEGVAGAAPARTLQEPPLPGLPQPQTAEGSHPPGAPFSSATDDVAGPAPALPGAVSTGSSSLWARPRTSVCVCVCVCVHVRVRACVRVYVCACARAVGARVRAYTLHALTHSTHKHVCVCDPAWVTSVTPRACTPQTGSYASALNTLAESNGAFATMAEVLFTQPPARGAQAA